MWASLPYAEMYGGGRVSQEAVAGFSAAHFASKCDLGAPETWGLLSEFSACKLMSTWDKVINGKLESPLSLKRLMLMHHINTT